MADGLAPEYTLEHAPSPAPLSDAGTDPEPDPETNMHVVLLGPEDIVLENRPLPALGDNDILVKVMSTGICGTDFSYYMRGGVGSRRAKGPHVLGHEAAGIVFRVGAAVRTVKVGDHVALEPALPCRHCRYCRAGQFNYCIHDHYFATPPTDGTLCRYFKCPASNAVPLPPGISWEVAGCIQPLAIAVQIARRARTLTHKVVAVFGAGPLGLLCIAVAKAYGARMVVAFDISASRIVFAEEYAADAGVIPPRIERSEDGNEVMAANDAAAASILASLGEPAFDVILECSGAESAMQLGISLLRPGGTFVAAGMGRPMTSFPSLELSAKELEVRGSLRYTTGCFEDAIDLISRKAVVIEPIISRTFPLAESEAAFQAVAAGSEIKIVIMNQE